MSAKTKIVVLHMKEIIYTAIFVVLGILLIILLAFMFFPKSEESAKKARYTPGIYTSTLSINNTDLEVEVSVDNSHINAIRFNNLSESVAAMYPLMQPTIESISKQIYEKQSLEDIQYSDENIRRILNTFGLWVQQGRTFKDGDEIEGVFEDCTVRLKEFEETGRKVLRVIIPDKNNVFPDDKKCLYPYSVQNKPTEMLMKKGGAEL